MAALFILFSDVVAAFFSIWLAIGLRFDIYSVKYSIDFLNEHHYGLAAFLFILLGFAIILRLYRCAWRFAGLEIVGRIVLITSLALLAWFFAGDITNEDPTPYSIYILIWVFTILAIGGIRLLLRIASLGHRLRRNFLQIFSIETTPATRAVILGANADGARLFRALTESKRKNYRIIGFLDDSPQQQGVLWQGAEVLGPLAMLHEMLANEEIDEVLVALPHGTPIRQLVLECRRRSIPVKIVPALADTLYSAVPRSLEDISVEDLLRRPPVRIEIGEIGGVVTGKRVLVTGAGGSIGSELCRQIASLGPAMLLLLGHGENSIHGIYHELALQSPESAARLQQIIASVADATRIDQAFVDFKPEIVFHAAAHKHVPIMEENIAEAVHNNVFGTRVIGEACARHGVERMVLISTDKAVFPSSVMGATKWLCEEVLCYLSAKYSNTTYVTVRFGNVLGSRGSVVPLFKQQIERGGPVTVTHAEMTRFFMSIPEAVQLVLQAGAIGKTGELFLLDMGEPVKIVDLARDMITLYGLVPGDDIAISYTGLRPGEKLHEQLVMDSSKLRPAAREGLSVIDRIPAFNEAELTEILNQLENYAAVSPQSLSTYLWDIVPGKGKVRDETEVGSKG